MNAPVNQVADALVIAGRAYSSRLLVVPASTRTWRKPGAPSRRAVRRSSPSPSAAPILVRTRTSRIFSRGCRVEIHLSAQYRRLL